MRKDDLNGRYFKIETDVAQNLIDFFFFLTVTIRGLFHRIDLSEKNMVLWEYFFKKRKLCMQNLTKKWKKPAVVILDSGAFILQFI